MRKVMVSILALLGLGFPATSHAEKVLVELFTSQGCSSCPPADEILGKLATRADVVALSLHVDYWDYLGWKDAFGQAAFTDRQKRYASTSGSSMIFTPQMVVGGVESVVGTRTMELMDAIAAHQRLVPVVAMSLGKSAAGIMVQAEVTGDANGPMLVQLVRYMPSQTVEIERGENAGRTVTYHNVVTDWSVLTEWDGDAPLDVTASVSGDSPSVVVIQEGASGPVLAVARID